MTDHVLFSHGRVLGFYNSWRSAPTCGTDNIALVVSFVGMELVWEVWDTTLQEEMHPSKS